MPDSGEEGDDGKECFDPDFSVFMPK